MPEYTLNENIRQRDDLNENDIKHLKYAIKSYAKKSANKDEGTKALMASTMDCALGVLHQIGELELHVSLMSVFVYCKDEQYRFISKEFEMQLELASFAPEKFIDGLHKFYNALSAKIRNKPEALKAFVEFCGIYSRLRYTKLDRGIDENVIIAYTNLILQAFEYLRKDKFDYRTMLVGVSLDGAPLMAKNPCPRLDYAAWQVYAMNARGQFSEEELVHAYNACGYPEVKSQADTLILYRKNRISQNMRLALLQYINEYTYDIVPETINNGQVRELALVKHDIDIDSIKEKLLRRKRTLPSNGVRVELSDPAEYFQSLLLKEIVKDDSVVLLYKLKINNEDYSGYYDTSDKFFYSPMIESVVPLHEFTTALVLFFYAAAVLDDEGFCDEKAPAHFTNFIFPINAKSFGMGGKLRNQYEKEPDANSTSRSEDDRYTTKEHAVNGYIRRLPAGQTASEQAKERAQRLGYDLEDNQTYVSPFIKTVFVRKDRQEIEEYWKNYDANSESGK